MYVYKYNKRHQNQFQSDLSPTPYQGTLTPNGLYSLECTKISIKSSSPWLREQSPDGSHANLLVFFKWSHLTEVHSTSFSSCSRTYPNCVRTIAGLIRGPSLACCFLPSQMQGLVVKPPALHLLPSDFFSTLHAHTLVLPCCLRTESALARAKSSTFSGMV